MKITIHREKYHNRILPFARKPVIKAITGQRRVGKSFLLHQVVDQIAEKPDQAVIWIDKEDEAFRSITDAESLIAHIKAHSSPNRAKTCIIIDEIQEIADFEAAIRSFAAREQYDIYITGSNSDILSGELASRLTGRFVEIPVFGLDFNEFCTFHGLEQNAESLKSFLKFGGMPFLRHLELVEEQAFEYLRGVAMNVVYKDIIARYNIRNVAFLDRLLYFLAGNVGSIVKAKNISDFLKSQKVSISVNTVLDYLGYLSASHLVMPVKRLDIRGKRTFEVGEKYYFQDTGIRNALFGYRISDIGQIMENVVWHHLASHGYEVFTGVQGGREIDFVAMKNNERIYIQVAYLLANESTVEREFGNLLAVRDNYRKMVVSMDDFTGGSYEGIEHVRLLDFLIKFG